MNYHELIGTEDEKKASERNDRTTEPIDSDSNALECEQACDSMSTPLSTLLLEQNFPRPLRAWTFISRTLGRVNAALRAIQRKRE